MNPNIAVEPNTVHITSGTDESVRANPPVPPFAKGGRRGDLFAKGGRGLPAPLGR